MTEKDSKYSSGEQASSARQENVNLPDLSVQELILALNDVEKAKELMKRHNWSRDDLLKRADFVAKRIAAGISNVAVV